ncbi:MAG: glycoside hydrolase family 30 beta sandwich domain-containing protein, partial [Phycisphaerae bacterium]
MSVTKSLRIFALIAVLISTGYAATGTINTNTRYQEIEGFGAAAAWYQNHLLYHQNANELYDLLFDELGLDIYRVRNTYNQGTEGTNYMNQTSQIVAAAKQRNPNLKVLISSWSPPASLKSNGSLSGGGNATLAKTGGGAFRYTDFANWWADSITAWAGYGVNADYISIQNEPDFDATWDSCRFNPTQTSSIAGYNLAFDAVYNALNSRFGSSMPKMLAPETTGFYGSSGHSLHNYLTAITNHSRVYGYCHHLYNIGAGDDPDQYISAMTIFNSSWGSKPLFQTEYEKATNVWPDAYNMALLLHNSLAVENVSSYLYWDLVWNTGGLVTIPSHGGSTYTINSDFYGLKHYSAFIFPGWRRVAATTNSYPNLRITAFVNPAEDQMTVVIINTHSSSTIGLDLSFQGFMINSGSVYRTTSSQNCVPIGTYNGTSTLNLPAKSVTTLSLSVTLGSIWLNTSSGPNGSVTVPGEGDFLYIKDTYADISATPDRFYDFSHWSGSAVSAGKVANPYDANTTVLMDTNYSVIANFVLGPVDTTPPTPNPMTWAVEPVASGSTSITMVATTATDESDPVQYYFYCVTDPSKSSSWQSSTTYTATDLNPMTSYSFMVKARDSYLTPNETAYSVAKAATTQTPLSTIHILDEWVSGDSIDIQAGPDRVLVLIAHAEYGNTNITLDSVTYGGQPMIKVDEIMVGTFSRAYAAAFILPESDIVLASDNMFVPTWSSEPSHTAYSSAFFAGVDQYNIIGAS